MTGIAVSGVTGGIGGRVAARLAARGVRARLVVRDPARAPAHDGAEVAVADYDDVDGALRTALSGVRTFFMVSAGEHPARVRQHLAAVDAAVAAGVERIVYTSFLGAAPDATFTLARHHWATEEHIRSTGLRHTFLRDSLYLDFIPFMAGDGVLRGPAGDGRVACVARDDVADVAVSVLLGEGHDGQTYDVTGPESLTMTEMAAILTELAGREVGYVDETMDEAWASRATYGAPDWEVEGWVTNYAAIAAGELETVSDTVPRLTGHPAMTLREFVARNPESLARLRA